MIIEKPTEEQMNALLPLEKMKLWNNLVKKIEERYDVDQIWSKGFGDWIYEYKFRRGGKTLCTLYMKNENANILITLGKAEREKYDTDRMLFSDSMNDLYDRTDSLHDGKWLWIPIEFDWNDISMLLRIKRRPNK
jgi:hypothetical protein